MSRLPTSTINVIVPKQRDVSESEFAEGHELTPVVQ